MEHKAYLVNPKTGRGAWFMLPFYFGKLSRIGLTGAFDEQVEVRDVINLSYSHIGLMRVEDLEALNREAERKQEENKC